MKTLPPLDPHQIVRRCDGTKYFGFKHSALELKIRDGEIPLPIPLSEKGRATGWTGQQIIDHHARMMRIAADHAAKRQTEMDQSLGRDSKSRKTAKAKRR